MLNKQCPFVRAACLLLCFAKNLEGWIPYPWFFWRVIYKHTVRKSRNITGQNKSPIFWYVVEHYRKRIEILHGHAFVGWPNRAQPSHPFLQKLADWLNCLCPVRSALKRTPVQDFDSFSIMLYYIYWYHISKKWRPILPCSYFWTFAVCKESVIRSKELYYALKLC